MDKLDKIIKESVKRIIKEEYRSLEDCLNDFVNIANEILDIFNEDYFSEYNIGGENDEYLLSLYKLAKQVYEFGEYMNGIVYNNRPKEIQEESIRKVVRKALNEIGGINDNIPYGNWMVDYDEKNYPNIFGEADENEGFDNMKPEDVKRLKGSYYEVVVPDYCLPYLVNGDMDNYTEEEIEAMKAFENEFNGKLANGLTAGDCCIPLDGTSPSFYTKNDVLNDGGCDCYLFCLPMKKENVHEAKSNKKEEDLDYTHYAVNKQTGKIVNGWDYNGYDSEDLKTFKRDYFFDDLASYDLNPKDYKIVTKKFLLRQGINPDDYANWSNN